MKTLLIPHPENSHVRAAQGSERMRNRKDKNSIQIIIIICTIYKFYLMPLIKLMSLIKSVYILHCSFLSFCREITYVALN